MGKRRTPVVGVSKEPMEWKCPPNKNSLNTPYGPEKPVSNSASQTPFLSPYYPTTPQRGQLSEQGRNGQTGHMQVYTHTHTFLLRQAQAAADESGAEKPNFCSVFRITLDYITDQIAAVGWSERFLLSVSHGNCPISLQVQGRIHSPRIG